LSNKKKNHGKTMEELLTELESLKKENLELKRGTSNSDQWMRSVPLLKDIVDKIPIGLHIYKLENINDDNTLTMVAANSASEVFTGIKINDVVGKTLDQNFPDLRAQGIPQLYAEVVRSGERKKLGDIHYGDKRVDRGWFSVEAFPLPDNCVCVSFKNVSKTKQMEKALSNSEEIYRAISQNSTDYIMRYDKQHRHIFANQAALDVSGLPINEYIGKTHKEMILMLNLKRGKCPLN